MCTMSPTICQEQPPTRIVLDKTLKDACTDSETARKAIFISFARNV